MMEKLIELDKELLLFFNSLHNPVLDPIMLVITNSLTWIPLYMILLYYIISDFRMESWVVIAGIAVTVLLADQITSTVMKPYFERLRPSHEPSLQGLVHIVNDYRGGTYGFASSHAANSFGVAFFLFLLYSQLRKWIVWMFLWAIVVTYSRVYLGVHYPSDVFVGSLIGILCGMAGYQFYRSVKSWRLRKE
jgi:undecaprenyl-diphosphatase